MGISEHLKRHSAEEELNLSDLALERESEREFNWEELLERIESDYKEKILSVVKYHWKNDLMHQEHDTAVPDLPDYNEFSELESSYHILFPGEVDKNEFSNEDARKRILRYFEEKRKVMESNAPNSTEFEFAIDDFYINAVEFKKTFPKHVDSLNINNNDFDYLKKEYEHWVKEGNQRAANRVAVYIRILFPNRFREMELTEEDRIDMVRKLNAYKRDGKWEDFVSLAVEYRLLYEEKYGLLHISREDRREMFEYIDIMVDEGDYFLTIYLGNLKMLLAERIIIDENKFTVVMPHRKDFPKKGKERPERRQF